MATGHDIAMGLRTAYLAMHRRTNATFARDGMTADQFVLLTALADGDGVTQKVLVERTGSDPNTMSEMLVRLERKRLVTRARHADDGRARCVTLTPLGRRVQARLWRASVAQRAQLESLFSNEARNAFVQGLSRVTAAMSAPAESIALPRPRSARKAAVERR